MYENEERPSRKLGRLSLCVPTQREMLNERMSISKRFVMIRNQGSEEATELIVVENFFEELKAKVGN